MDMHHHGSLLPFRALALFGLLALVIAVSLAPSATADSSAPAPKAAQFTSSTAPKTPVERLAFMDMVVAEDARVVTSMVMRQDVEADPPPPPPPPPPPKIVEPAEPPSVKGLRFWSGGDSTATYMSIRLVDIFAALGAAETGTYYQKSTGLARPDYFDWFARLQSVVEVFEPDIVVFMVGANDPQGIKDANGTTHWPFSDEWTTLYAGRVGQVMDLLADDERYAVYVGQPNMGQTDFAVKMQTINGIIKSEADKRPGVGYLDAWALFSDASGAYSSVLPDDNSVPTLYRAADGIHFTWAGGEHLAMAVVNEVHRQIASRPCWSWLPPGEVFEFFP